MGYFVYSIFKQSRERFTETELIFDILSDKHGLVNRFSRILEQNGINHMYSSTYKTANLLVDKAHADQAQALLSC